MLRSTALSRAALPALVLMLLCAGCAPVAEAPHVAAAAPGAQAAAVRVTTTPSITVPTTAETIPPAPTTDAASRQPDATAALPAGALYLNPATGRKEMVEPNIGRTAVLIGDSQSEGAAGVVAKNTWTNTALANLGYNVEFRGRGGTGFVAANGRTGNYPDALENGNWYLPYGQAPLVVIQGGGNDASRGATDEQIMANAARLLKDLKQTYPESKFVMIGTLAKGTPYGGARRSQVDALLGTFATQNHIPFVSVGDWITLYGVGDKLADGVHLTAAGHRVLADVLSRQLTALGVTPPIKGTGAVVARLSKVG
ncbi:SGNH/GDSL hydrolase family protein [Arthrobacter sp. A5]|uniref:SGNH/GDSL hydrolase family protein n=1 Tax=Arthrobacter sp. A5 TaxID=576926 RepID=UPI003DA9AAD2